MALVGMYEATARLNLCADMPCFAGPLTLYAYVHLMCLLSNVYSRWCRFSMSQCIHGCQTHAY